MRLFMYEGCVYGEYKRVKNHCIINISHSIQYYFMSQVRRIKHLLGCYRLHCILNKRRKELVA